MTYSVVRLTRQIFLLLMLFSSQLIFVAQVSAGPLSVYTHTGSREGFYSNSHLLISEGKGLLIDAQFNVDDARALTDVIEHRKLTLDTVVLTHPHPDHYYGLEHCSETLASAEVIAGPITAAIVQRTFDLWAKQQQQVAGCQRQVRSLSSASESAGESVSSLLFADHPFQITHLQNRESVENTVIHVPGIAALFTGDLVSNGFHLWLAEGRIDRWINALEELEQLQNVTTVYPGHGSPGSFQLIAETRAYIQRFQKVINEADNPVDAIRQMQKMYPDYQLIEVMVASVHRMMAQ